MGPITTILLVLPTIISGLNYETVKFSLDYFQKRNVRFICIINCEGNLKSQVDFTKAASKRYLAVTVKHTSSERMSDENIGKCVRQENTPIGVLMDAKCEAGQIFNFASENKLLDATHYWLIVDHDTNNQSINDTLYGKSDYRKIIGILENLNISVDADILIGIKRVDTFILYDVFNFGKVQGGNLIVNYTGFWNISHGFVADLNSYKYYRRWDFGQWAMRMISVATFSREHFDPKMLTDVRPVPGIATVTRSSTMCIATIAEIHNIRFKHSLANRWVGPTNRSYVDVAVTTALYFETQDLSSLCRFYPALNLDVITYIQPSLTYLETRYYYRIPTTGAGKFENQFLRPLSLGSWIGVLSICLLCCIVLLVAAKLEARKNPIQYAVFSIIATISQQFFEDEYQSIRLISSARKLILFIAGMACVLVYNYYTSSVVSWLLNGPPPSVTSLEELLHSPLELIYQDVGYTRSWFYTPGYYFNKDNKKIEDLLRRKVLSKKAGKPVLLPLEEGIALVKAGGYAYHAETTSADDRISRTFTQDEVCELGSLSSIKKAPLFAITQRNSPYKEFLNWSILRIKERGIVSSILRRTTPQPVTCGGVTPRALALGGAAPALIMLAFGYFISVIILVAER